MSNLPLSSIQDGWDSKPSLSNISLIKKPAMILVVPNPAFVTEDMPSTEILLTDHFILQQFQETHIEKVQVMETFSGTSVLSFFDEKTKVYGLSGTLLEAKPHNKYRWESMWREFWDKHLRGTQLARKKKIAILVVGENLIYFYPTNFSINKVAASPHTSSFNMQMIVTKHKVLHNEKLYMMYQFGIDVSKDLLLPDIIKARAEEDDRLQEEKSKGQQDAQLINQLIHSIIGYDAQITYLEKQSAELTSNWRQVVSSTFTSGGETIFENEDLQAAYLEDITAAIDEGNRIYEELSNTGGSV